jgi:hypothetical protein
MYHYERIIVYLSAPERFNDEAYLCVCSVVLSSLTSSHVRNGDPLTGRSVPGSRPPYV